MSSPPPRLVLGSQSAGRRAVLSQSGLPFACMKADIDEKAVKVDGEAVREDTDPRLLTVAIAQAKAKALLPALEGTDRILITSGTSKGGTGRGEAET